MKKSRKNQETNNKIKKRKHLNAVYKWVKTDDFCGVSPHPYKCDDQRKCTVLPPYENTLAPPLYTKQYCEVQQTIRHFVSLIVVTCMTTKLVTFSLIFSTKKGSWS